MAKKTKQRFTNPGLYRGPFPNGAPAIYLNQAARLGASCGITACVGDDDFGWLNINRLSADGMDVSGVCIFKTKSTGTAFMTYGNEDGREYIFRFTDAAASAFSLDDIDGSALNGDRIIFVRSVCYRLGTLG